MPQRRFKFKLCRLARGERSLDSLPIIQLFLPSPSLFLSLFLPLLFILFHLSAVYFLRHFLARVNRWLSLLSLLFAPVKVLKKKFPLCILCICFSLFCIQLSLIRGFLFRWALVLFVFALLFGCGGGVCRWRRKRSPFFSAYCSRSVIFCLCVL